MGRGFRQQAASKVNIDVFNGDRTEYHYLFSVYGEVVEKKIDNASSRITILVKYTDGDPNEMIQLGGICQNYAHNKEPPILKNMKSY